MSVPAQGADPIGAVSIGAVVREIWNVVDIDEGARGREPKFHHRQQALSSGEHLGLTGPQTKKLDRLIDRCRRLVAES